MYPSVHIFKSSPKKMARHLVCRSVCAFDGEEGELTMRLGEQVLVCALDLRCGDWILAHSFEGGHGYVPRAFLEEVAALPGDDFAENSAGEEDFAVEENFQEEEEGPKELEVGREEKVSGREEKSSRREEEDSRREEFPKASPFSSLANVITKAKKVVHEKSAVLVFYRREEEVVKLCFRARSERVRSHIFFVTCA